MPSDVTILGRRHADANHDVVTVAGGGSGYRKTPCPDCPWRRDAEVGAFPAEAFRHSARTAYDLSRHRFGCHASGAEKPATCAGFLLSGAAHNLSVRLDVLTGRVDLGQVSSPVPLYDSYREMAEANGVAPDDAALAPCRSPASGPESP